MAHAQKPGFVFRRKGRVHLNRRRASVQSTTGSRVVRISGNNAGYTMFRGSVKSTGYPLHSPVSPSLPLPCVTVCHHISAWVYLVHAEVWGEEVGALVNFYCRVLGWNGSITMCLQRDITLNSVRQHSHFISQGNYKATCFDYETNDPILCIPLM